MDYENHYKHFPSRFYCTQRTLYASIIYGYTKDGGFCIHADNGSCIHNFIARQLDAHRKPQQASFPKLTLTAMYGVLEKSRAGESLSAKERKIAEQAELQELQRLHDELDAAVADVYGWPVGLDEQEVLRRLLELNSQRIEKEKSDQASLFVTP